MNAPQMNWNVHVAQWPGYFVRERQSANLYRAEIGTVDQHTPKIVAEVVQEGGEFRFYLTHSVALGLEKAQIGRSYRSGSMANRRARAWVRRNFKRSGRAGSWLRFAGTFVVALVVYSLIMLSSLPSGSVNQGTTRPDSPSAYPRPLATAPAPADGRELRAESEVKLFPDELLAVQTIGKALGVQLGAPQSAESWFVFADPLCPYCHAMQPAIDALQEPHRPVVIPIGLRGELSAEVVASFFEAADRSEQPTVELWRSFMDQSFDEERARDFISRYPASPANKKKGQVTQALFSKLGLKKTPTVVSADGRLTGPLNSAGDIRDWLGLPQGH
ncbi:thioredoxin fold domain-containing protein [Achromobacter animicus]|uniref:thioredoxin fold domain-containing protein n=1 Tax=Achromobacter animicus TaxID=1389935 RepID=UPI0024472E80|nr:thioredoxin fold domain-containing protein [Achromobacter animicus]MDH0683100.1 hypothetical protein [Achromobacter animicus]